MGKVVITLGNVKSKIINLNRKHFEILRKELGWRDKGYFFTDQYQKNKGWDGYTSVLTKAGYFPTGVYESVINKLKALGVSCRVVDKRYKLSIDHDKVIRRLENLGIVLRPYQVEGVMKGLEHPYMLFQWPTGSGKAILFASLIQLYNLRTLIIVNRKELMYQLANVLKEVTDLKIGMIGDGKWEPERVTVASIDTLAKRIKEQRTIDFLKLIRYFIADESHHLGATTWKNVAKKCSNAVIRHGFSGTCFRTDSKDILLMAATGPIKHVLATSQLIDEGYLSTPHIDLIYMNNDDIDDSMGWQYANQKLLVNNKKRNLIAVKYIKYNYEQGRQVLVITNRVRPVNHPKIIQDMLLNDEQLPWKDVRVVTGSRDTSFRRKALADFRDRRLPILIGTSIYDEGVDLPSADCGVNLAGGDSSIKTIQRLGRILRKTKGEYDFDIDPKKPQIVNYLDFIDHGSKFTKRHSYHRASEYEKEKAFVVNKSSGHDLPWFPHELLE